MPWWLVPPSVWAAALLAFPYGQHVRFARPSRRAGLRRGRPAETGSALTPGMAGDDLPRHRVKALGESPGAVSRAPQPTSFERSIG